MITIALVNPEIPQNAGNIARLTAVTGLKLAFVGSLGFELSDKYLKRAGLDYWEHVDCLIEPDVTAYFDAVDGRGASVACLSTKATRPYTDIPVPGEESELVIALGSESAGLPREVLLRYDASAFRIPMRKGFRSLNVSASAALVAFDVLRRCGFPGLT